EGAVFLEVDLGLREVSAYSSIARLGVNLGSELEALGLGRFGGMVRIPELSTLIFYGPNADAIYCALEPLLESGPGSQVARVVIRQGVEQRVIARHKAV